MHTSMQAARGVLYSSFELKVDAVTAMKISAKDMDALYNASTAVTTNQPVVSAVVFRSDAFTIPSAPQLICAARHGAKYCAILPAFANLSRADHISYSTAYGAQVQLACHEEWTICLHHLKLQDTAAGQAFGPSLGM